MVVKIGDGFKEVKHCRGLGFPFVLFLQNTVQPLLPGLQALNGQMHVLRSDELDQESRGRMKDGENENQDDQANVPGNADVQHEQETHAAIANGEKAVAGDLKAARWD